MKKQAISDRLVSNVCHIFCFGEDDCIAISTGECTSNEI